MSAPLVNVNGGARRLSGVLAGVFALSVLVALVAHVLAGRLRSADAGRRALREA